MSSHYLSHADLGGQPGKGPVQPEPEGELWHAGWEPKALALTLAMGATGSWSIDQSRAARETLLDYAQLGLAIVHVEANLLIGDTGTWQWGPTSC